MTSKVTKLALSDASGDNLEPTTRIHVLIGGISDMQTDLDLEKMVSVSEAKKSFNSRTDIVCFITAEDLIKLQKHESKNSKTYLRLVIETPHRKNSGVSSPKISPNRESRSSAPKDTPLTIRRENRRSQSVGNDKAVNGVNTSYKVVALEGNFFTVSYIIDEAKYSVFILKKIADDNKLFCVGARDNNIRSEDIKNYESSTVVNINTGLKVVLFAEKIIPEPTFPAYFSIMGSLEYNIEQFLEICQVLLEQLVEQYRKDHK